MFGSINTLPKPKRSLVVRFRATADVKTSLYAKAAFKGMSFADFMEYLGKNEIYAFDDLKGKYEAAKKIVTAYETYESLKLGPSKKKSKII